MFQTHMYWPYTHKSTYTDLIITNRPNLFQHSSAFETDLSDFHLLMITEFKMGFQKLKPKITAYRNYKNFDNAKFRYDIVTATSNVGNFSMYKSVIFDIFNRHVHIKRNYILANEAPFMSKELHKVIMKRSRLRNIFLKHKTDTDKKNYSTQRNLCKKTLEQNTKKILKKLLITQIFEELSYRYLPKIHQNMRKLTSLVIVKPYLVTRISVRHLIDFSLM